MKRVLFLLMLVLLMSCGQTVPSSTPESETNILVQGLKNGDPTVVLASYAQDVPVRELEAQYLETMWSGSQNVYQIECRVDEQAIQAERTTTTQRDETYAQTHYVIERAAAHTTWEFQWKHVDNTWKLIKWDRTTNCIR